LKAAFSDAEKTLKAAATETQERANAAMNASALAAGVAWKAFDAGRFDEAATWFARRADLKKESYANRIAFYETTQTEQAAALEKQLDANYQADKERLAATKDAGERATLMTLAVGAINTRHALTFAVAKSIQMESLQNNDLPTYLKYERKELDLKKGELADLQALPAPDSEILKKRAEIAAAIGGVAGAYRYQAAYADAEKAYLESLALRQSLPADTPGRDLATAYSDLGGLYADMGDLRKAQDDYQRALKAWDEDEPQRKAALAQVSPDLKDLMSANFTLSQTLILNNLGQIASGLGDMRGSIRYYREALKAAESLPETGLVGTFRAQMRGTILGNIAVYYGDSGDLDRAIKEMQSVVQLKRSIGDDESAAVSLQNLGSLYFEKGDLPGAQRSIEQARQIFVAAQNLRNVVSSSLALASLANENGDAAKAEGYAQEALALARKIGDESWISAGARSLANLRIKGGQLEEAARLLREAEEGDARTGAPLDRSYTLELQGRLLEARGDDAGAAEKYKAAIDLLEGVRSTANSESDFANLRNNYRPYEEIVKLLIKMGKTEDAFDYLNRSKSKRMNDALQLSSVKTHDKALQSLLDRATGLQDRLRSAQAALETEQAKPAGERDAKKIQNLKLVAASTQAEFFKVSEEIKATNPNYESLMTVKPRELKTAQRSIPEGVIFIEYAPIGDQLYIFLVTRNDLKIYAPPVKPDDLWNRIKEYRKLMNDARDRIADGESLSVKDWMSDDPNVKPLRENLTALYDMLIAPIEPEIKGETTLAFIPTQLLYYLPIHALAKKDGSGLRFLIQDKQVVYLTGADVMAVVQRRDPSELGKGLEAFGNPAGIDPPLPHSQDEVKTIAQVYPDSEALTGAQATKSAVVSEKSQDRRILHFATHGVLNSVRPTESYIALAKEPDPGASELTVGEVMGMDLSKVDLVTLSACQTALGEKDPGVEVSGLAAAFSTAGASSVVASLWSVSDESTDRIMVSFYKGLSEGKSKAVALQAAETALLQDPKFNHPFYWAPFILMGDWR
jgi:CHAT domain-containing protein